ncbi:FAD-dependent oxidoreductase [Pseudoalteromonas sp. T1lg65]|uniref:FAD-dependent oxidoreductase n=1 Tax=Pseudoalteromonas sp. T1lg65 TaxID=2077101 RepID=UPI003F7ABD01
MKNKALIVGGGMVGAACAVKLAKQGCEVTLIETSPIDAEQILQSEQVDIRVSAINRFSELLLEELGAMSSLKSARNAQYRQLEAYEDKPGQLIFDCDEVNSTHLGHIIENNLIQAALWRQFAELKIQVKSPQGQPISLTQDDEGVTLLYQQDEFNADLLIAADGGRSQIRQLARIGVTGWQYDQHCMGILIKLDAPQQHKTWQQFTPNGPIAFLPMQYPYANLIWYDEGSKLKQLSGLSHATLKQKIIETFFELPGDFDVEQVAVFPLARQHANQYVANRVVLVGDAAHTINPLAGQGVNLGFKDVAALSDVLNNADDIGSLSLLRKYEKKRRTDNLLMMSMMDACYFGFSNSVGPLKALRNIALNVANKAGPLKREVLKHAMGGIS